MIQKFLLTLSFFTRIPIGKHDLDNVTLAQSVAYFPIIGAIIGGLTGVAYLTFIQLGLTHNIAAWCTIIFYLILTGGLHEDGLADTADGLTTGRNREQKLTIMRDSRIGSYGVLALITIISLRANIIANFSNNLHTILVLITAAACSRAFIVVFMRNIPYSRNDGLAKMAGKPTLRQTIISVLIATLSVLITKNSLAIITSIFIFIIMYKILKYVFYRNFGGITGDTLGASQQISEVALLLAFAV